MITIKLIANKYGDVVFGIDANMIRQLGWTPPCTVSLRHSDTHTGLLLVDLVSDHPDPPPAHHTTDSEPSTEK